MTNPEDDQSLVESAWGEKTWDNFYTNLSLKYGKKKQQLEKLQSKTINKVFYHVQ